MPRPIPLFLSMVLLFATLAAIGLPSSHAGTLNRGPYLQQATSDSVVVVWRTEGASTPVLRFGTASEDLSSEVKGAAVTLRVSADVDAPSDVPRLYLQSPEDAAKRKPQDKDPSTPPNTYQYEAHVAGLQPATRYYYAVYDGETRLAGGDGDHYFVTHPVRGSTAAMRLWVVGDSGTGDENQAAVHTAMRNYVEQTGRAVDHYLHVGDMAYGKGTDPEFQRNFFAPYQATLRNTVCWPSMGNHEGGNSRGLTGTGPYYDAYVVPTAAEAGGVASGTEAYYSFDIADVHFICLDSHDLDRSPEAAMAQWLRADLEQTQAKWLIAFWHHPPYTKGSHDSDRETQLIEMRENFMPILESGGVDVTLTGHSHIYERSMLIDGAYATPTVADNVVLDDGDGNPNGDGAYRKSEGLHPNEGAVAVVTGNGGASMSRRGTSPVMREIILEYGSVIIDIDGDTLKGIMLNKDGHTRDLFSIVKQGKVTPQRIEKPWQPVHDLSLITRHNINFTEEETGARPTNWKVVAGDGGAATVAAQEDGKRKHLVVKSGGTASIGLFDPVALSAFDFETLIRLPENGAVPTGLVLAYVDPGNYHRVVFDMENDAIRIIQVVNGEEEELESRAAALEPGKWIELVCVTGESKLLLRCLEDMKFETPLPANLPEGRLGFYVAPGGQAEFLAFQIKR